MSRKRSEAYYRRTERNLRQLEAAQARLEAIDRREFWGGRGLTNLFHLLLLKIEGFVPEWAYDEALAAVEREVAERMTRKKEAGAA